MLSKKLKQKIVDLLMSEDQTRYMMEQLDTEDKESVEDFLSKCSESLQKLVT